MAILSIKMADIRIAQDRIRSLMQHNVKRVGKRTGWHQYIGENKVGDVATGQGILIMHYLRFQYPFLLELMNTLREGQFLREHDPDNGGWALLSSRETPTVEATVWSMMGLLAGGEAESMPTIQSGKNWLLNNQNDDGGWGPRKPLESRLYTTFLACRCLATLETRPSKEQLTAFRDTMRWILNGQNDDGGWGERPAQKSSVIHTAFALLVLHYVGLEPEAASIRKGVRYLYQHWDEKRMWQGSLTTERYEIPSTQQDNRAWARVSIEYFPTPWAILALLSAGESATDERIFSSARWLMQTQNDDGSWTLENIQRNRLWAVHDALLALNTFAEKIITDQTANRLYLLEHTLLVSSKTHKNTLLRQVFVSAFSLFTIGIAVGLILSAFLGFNNPVKFWIEKYWAWLILGIYIISAVPLVRLRVINWKDALFGIIVPVLLVIIPFFLAR